MSDSIQEKNGGYQVEINGNTYEISFWEGGIAKINGETIQFDIEPGVKPDRFSLLLDGRSIALTAEDSDEPGQTRVHAGGYDFDAQVITSQEAYLRKYIQGADVGKKVGKVKAPMPGLIVKLLVAVGDTVEKGDGVMIMEAMKMENEIKAPVKGIVKKFHVEPGGAVDKNAMLVEIE